MSTDTPTGYVLAVDPGLMSGVALLDRNGPKVLWSAELEWEPLVEAVDDWLRRLAGTEVHVVAERFVITMQTARKSPAPWSLQVIGMLMLLSKQHDTGTVWLQSPSDAKAVFGNDVLKKLDCWHVGGKGHALDAIRHGLLHMVKTGWRDRRMVQ